MGSWERCKYRRRRDDKCEASTDKEALKTGHDKACQQCSTEPSLAKSLSDPAVSLPSAGAGGARQGNRDGRRSHLIGAILADDS